MNEWQLVNETWPAPYEGSKNIEIRYTVGEETVIEETLKMSIAYVNWSSCMDRGDWGEVTHWRYVGEV